MRKENSSDAILENGREKSARECVCEQRLPAYRAARRFSPDFPKHHAIHDDCALQTGFLEPTDFLSTLPRTPDVNTCE